MPPRLIPLRHYLTDKPIPVQPLTASPPTTMMDRLPTVGTETGTERRISTTASMEKSRTCGVPRAYGRQGSLAG